MSKVLESSELILNEDGSIYHLHLQPEQIANTIITVGDPDRVEDVSKHFDRLEHRVSKREFVTHTGYIGTKRLSVISTGIGTDNIDIVFNELDALVNVDLKNRVIKEELQSLNFIRIGTSGTMHPEIPVDSFLASAYALGMEGLMEFYHRDFSDAENALQVALDRHLLESGLQTGIRPLVAEGNAALRQTFDLPGWLTGLTITATGFYAPQNRQIRAKSKIPNLFSALEDFEHDQLKVTNLEMETAGIYGMSKLLGHRAISLNAILANRRTGKFSKHPKAIVETLIKRSLEVIVDKELV